MSQLPEDMIGAIALCFASAPNHLSAVSKAVESLKERQYEIIDLAGNINEIDYKRWDEYVVSVWPEFSAHLPSREVVLNCVLEGGVFYGPFCGWEKQ